MRATPEAPGLGQGGGSPSITSGTTGEPCPPAPWLSPRPCHPAAEPIPVPSGRAAAAASSAAPLGLRSGVGGSGGVARDRFPSLIPPPGPGAGGGLCSGKPDRRRRGGSGARPRSRCPVSDSRGTAPTAAAGRAGPAYKNLPPAGKGAAGRGSAAPGPCPPAGTEPPAPGPRRWAGAASRPATGGEGKGKPGGGGVISPPGLGAPQALKQHGVWGGLAISPPRRRKGVTGAQPAVAPAGRPQR